MPEKASNKEEKKCKIIIYHGHLHKIPLDDKKKEYKPKKGLLIKESIN